MLFWIVLHWNGSDGLPENDGMPIVDISDITWNNGFNPATLLRFFFALNASTSDFRTLLSTAASLYFWLMSARRFSTDKFSTLTWLTCVSSSVKWACFLLLERRADSLFESITLYVCRVHILSCFSFPLSFIISRLFCRWIKPTYYRGKMKSKLRVQVHHERPQHSLSNCYYLM